MKKLLFFLIIWMSNNFTAYANVEITETISFNTLKKVIKESNRDTLVVFDVQGVLMMAKDQILTPHFKKEYRALKDKIKNNYTPEQQEHLLSIILKDYETILVDRSIKDIFSALKIKGAKVIALTSGYTSKFGLIKKREDIRIKRLKDLGLDFSESFPNTGVVEIKNLENIDSSHPPLFKEGVLFSCRLPKGLVLKAFLKEMNYKPKKIIFADNQLKNLNSMKEYCEEHGITFHGFHYINVLKRIRVPLEEKIAAYQFEILEKERRWISDAEAKKRLQLE